MISIARILGAPVIEPLGNVARRRSTVLVSARSCPLIVETRWWTVSNVTQSARR
jgi:hypothetical protein